MGDVLYSYRKQLSINNRLAGPCDLRGVFAKYLLSQARLLILYYNIKVSSATSLIVTLFGVRKALEYRASDIPN